MTAYDKFIKCYKIETGKPGFFDPEIHNIHDYKEESQSFEDYINSIEGYSVEQIFEMLKDLELNRGNGDYLGIDITPIPLEDQALISRSHEFENLLNMVEVVGKNFEMWHERSEKPVSVKITEPGRIAFLCEDWDWFVQREARYFGGSID